MYALHPLTDLAQQRAQGGGLSSVRGPGTPASHVAHVRRTYASWAHEVGMPGKVIAQLMGHAKVDTTLNVYAQVLDGSVPEAAERVGSRLITIDHSAPEVASNQ